MARILAVHWSDRTCYTDLVGLFSLWWTAEESLQSEPLWCFLAQCKHTVCEIRKQSWHRIWYIANNNLSAEYRRMVEVRIFDFISEYKRELCLNSASKPKIEDWTIILYLPVHPPLIALLTDRAFCNCICLFCCFFFMSRFGSFSSSAQLLSLSLFLSVDCELI